MELSVLIAMEGDICRESEIVWNKLRDTGYYINSTRVSRLEDAINKIDTMDFDIFIIDYEFGEMMNGAELARLILEKKPKAKIIITSFHDSYILLHTIHCSGALCIIRKDHSEDYIKAIRACLKGKHYYSHTFEDKLNKIVKLFNTYDDVYLTKKELEILKDWLKEMTYKQIAKEMHISVKTVGIHKGHIDKKLHGWMHQLHSLLLEELENRSKFYKIDNCGEATKYFQHQ